jgi:hypothetical protein
MEEINEKLDLIMKKLIEYDNKLTHQCRAIQDIRTLVNRQHDKQIKQLKACSESFHLCANAIYNGREELSEAIGSGCVLPEMDIKIV